MKARSDHKDVEAVGVKYVGRDAEGDQFLVDLANGSSVPMTVSFSDDGIVRFKVGDNSDISPLPDIGVASGLKPSMSRDASTRATTLFSKGLVAEISHSEFAIQVRRDDDEILWETSRQDMDQKGRRRAPALSVRSSSPGLLGAAFAVGYDDHFLGFGEKFCNFDKKGLTIVSDNSNAGGATSEKAYKNVPFFLNTRGFGILFNTTRRIVHDVANPQLSILSYLVSVDGSQLDFMVIDGPHPKEVLRKYKEITGSAPVPPLWTYGLWVSRFYFENWEVVLEAGREFRRRGIPADVINPDVYWMKGNALTDMQWDEQRFPDPAGNINYLRELGFRVCLWEFPYLSSSSPLWNEAVENNYLALTPDGQPYFVPTTLPQPCHDIEGFRGVGTLKHVYLHPLVEPGALIDFTNPAAVEWWKELHRLRLREGVAVFKADFGEDVPADARFYDGRTGRDIHNIYPLLYQQVVAEATAEVTGSYVVWGRSGWAGGQKLPIHWGGDPTTSFQALAATLRAGLSYGLSGVPFWSHDIGGFAGPPPSKELYVRWSQFGLLSSHSRLQGTTPREPWEFGDEACRIFKAYAELRYRLLPYLYDLGVTAATTGVPVMRACYLEFPEDPGCRLLDTQYLLGPDLLIAPVLNDKGHVQVYLPAGIDWIDFWTDELLSGGQWIVRQNLPLAEMPIYIRSGAIIPVAPPIQSTDRLDCLKIGFEIAPINGLTRSFRFPDQSRASVSMTIDGKTVRLIIDGPAEKYNVVLRGGPWAETRMTVAGNIESGV